jgi:hypothetical protein
MLVRFEARCLVVDNLDVVVVQTMKLVISTECGAARSVATMVVPVEWGETEEEVLLLVAFLLGIYRALSFRITGVVCVELAVVGWGWKGSPL